METSRAGHSTTGPTKIITLSLCPHTTYCPNQILTLRSERSTKHSVGDPVKVTLSGKSMGRTDVSCYRRLWRGPTQRWDPPEYPRGAITVTCTTEGENRLLDFTAGSVKITLRAHSTTPQGSGAYFRRELPVEGESGYPSAPLTPSTIVSTWFYLHHAACGPILESKAGTYGLTDSTPGAGLINYWVSFVGSSDTNKTKLPDSLSRRIHQPGGE